jgi:hypothetical protein
MSEYTVRPSYTNYLSRGIIRGLKGRSNTMSKKNRKARRPNVPMYTGPVAPTQPQAAKGGGGEFQITAAQSRPAASRETIVADYTHVISDLKRIGLLAGSLFVILIVLSFFIK